MKFHIILLSGGSGVRVGGEIPKQFLELAGRPVLAHSLDSFVRWEKCGSIVLVARMDLMSATKTLADDVIRNAGREPGKKTGLGIVVSGGATRHASTLCGLGAVQDYVEPNDVFLVHDAARPLVENSELDRLADYMADLSRPVASLVAPISDTIVRRQGDSDLPVLMSERLERSELFAVKTPQALRVRTAWKLKEIPEEDSFTDLLSWAEAAGIKGGLVQAGACNHKLTTKEDLPFLEFLLERRAR